MRVVKKQVDQMTEKRGERTGLTPSERAEARRTIYDSLERNKEEIDRYRVELESAGEAKRRDDARKAEK